MLVKVSDRLSHHERLRTMSFHSRRSMHSLLLEGVDLVLKKHGGK